MTKRRYNPTKTQRSARKEAASVTKTQPSQKNKVVDAIRSIKGLSPKDQAIALLAASANQLTAAAIDKLSAKEARHSARAPQLSADRKSTRLNSSHANISYAVFCLKKKSGR